MGSCFLVTTCRTAQSVFSVKYKLILPSSSSSVYKVLHCFILLCFCPQSYSRYLSSESMKKALGSLQVRDRPQLLRSRRGNIGPFPAPRGTEGSRTAAPGAERKRQCLQRHGSPAAPERLAPAAGLPAAASSQPLLQWLLRRWHLATRSWPCSALLWRSRPWPWPRPCQQDANSAAGRPCPQHCDRGRPVFALLPAQELCL